MRKFFLKVAFREKEYIIAYKSLKDGDYEYSWSLDKSFTDHFVSTEIMDISVEVDVHLIKSSRLLQFLFKVSGNITFECDRCLDLVSLPVELENEMIFKIEGKENNFEEEILYLSEEESIINMAPFIYENIIFSFPIKRVHGTDKKGKSLCNKDMIKKLETLLVKDEKPVDERWNDLNKLLNN